MTDLTKISGLSRKWADLRRRWWCWSEKEQRWISRSERDFFSVRPIGGGGMGAGESYSQEGERSGVGGLVAEKADSL